MDRAYQNMLAVAKERLKGRNPYQIASNANMIYEENNQLYRLQSLGKELVISYPDYECAEKLNSWYHLVLLHYMDLADGTQLRGNLLSFAGLKDGVIRGTKFDCTVEMELQKILNGKSQREIEEALKALGGEKRYSRADLCMEIPFLPMYPITVNIWFADEEYPTSGKILLDESADHYLTVEDAVTVGELILERIAEAFHLQV